MDTQLKKLMLYGKYKDTVNIR